MKYVQRPDGYWALVDKNGNVITVQTSLDAIVKEENKLKSSKYNLLSLFVSILVVFLGSSCGPVEHEVKPIDVKPINITYTVIMDTGTINGYFIEACKDEIDKNLPNYQQEVNHCADVRTAEWLEAFVLLLPKENE